MLLAFVANVSSAGLISSRATGCGSSDTKVELPEGWVVVDTSSSTTPTTVAVSLMPLLTLLLLSLPIGIVGD